MAIADMISFGTKKQQLLIWLGLVAKENISLNKQIHALLLPNPIISAIAILVLSKRAISKSLYYVCLLGFRKTVFFDPSMIFVF